MSKWDQSRCVLTPLPTTTTAREPFHYEVKGCPIPSDLELFVARETIRGVTANTHSELLAQAEKIYSEFCSLATKQWEV